MLKKYEGYFLGFLVIQNPYNVNALDFVDIKFSHN